MIELDFHGLLGTLILIGLATGTLTGLTGASGMSILISALLLAEIDIREVIGLTFVVTLVNSAIALGPYWRHGHVDARSGCLVAFPAIGTVLLGHLWAKSVQPGSLTGVMVCFLFLIGTRFLLSPGNESKDQNDARNLNDDKSGEPSINVARAKQPGAWLLVLMGCVAGLLMGIMGGGGAVFIGVVLILLFKMDTKTAIGTSILIMGLAAIPGVIMHWSGGTIEVPYVMAILSASIPAAFAASWFANRISKSLVKRMLGAYLVVISVFLVYRTYL